MRFWLAFSCFFRLLFFMKLPAAAARYLPADALPKGLPEPDADAPAAAAEPAAAEPAAAEPAAAEPAQPRRPPANAAELRREGALALLGLFQREGRLVDFLQEAIDDYDDADVGAAARDIHRGCKKALDDHVRLEPIMPGNEDDTVTIKPGFDPGEIRLSGDVSGEPPFTGVLRHHGWRAVEVNLPVLGDQVDRSVIAPAEVEIG
ncbi:MAG: DUF2760 domain-containing protein [Deltaproteobacteria bacterium]|nr:MAG: DUF2760 domain-containing protein [Deltaproteobacteria bacterium]